MTNITTKQARKRKPQEEVISLLASKYSVSTRYINMVISGDEKNKAILADYIAYKEEHSKLLEAVKQLVPFN